MAQLKDTVIAGSLRVTDTIYTNDLAVSASKTAKYVLAAPNAAAGAPTWRALSNSDVGLSNVENTKLSTWAGTSNITTVGTITSGTWRGTAIASAYIGSHGNHVPTTQTANNITFLRNDNSWYKLVAADVSTLINLLSTGDSELTANDYVITQYVGGGTTTTSYHRRPGSKVVNATLVKAALGTVATTAKKFLKDTGSWTQVDWEDLTGKPSTFSPSTHTHSYAGSDSTGGAANTVKTAAVTGSTGIKGYITYSAATTGSNALIDQDSLYVYNTMSNNVPTEAYICIGKSQVKGGISLFSATNASAWGNLVPATITANTTRIWTLPNASGTIALTSSDITGNAATATKLATARAINGTDFDGSAAITTANWGTARTLTIGPTGRSVNGSGNVSWSTSEILSNQIIDTHGEGNCIKILDSGNYLYAFYDRGGTCTAYEVDASVTDFTVELTPLQTLAQLPVAIFSGGLGYPGGSYTGSNWAVYDLKLPSTMSYGQRFFWSFGNGSWSATKMRILASSAADGSTWTQFYTSDSCPSYGQCSIGFGATSTKWIRIVVNKYTRLCCFGAYPYSYSGMRTTYMSTSMDDAIYRSITPGINDKYSLGSSSNKWKNIYGVSVYGAVWNDYAEYRKSDLLPPGACVQENDNGKLTASDHRLIPGCSIISDTYGFAQGETDDAHTPVAVSGRVLAYTFLPRYMYHAGMAVCSAPGGTIDIMTREEIREYPDAIVGYVSEIPDYEEWGTGKVKVNGRIWIKVK